VCRVQTVDFAPATDHVPEARHWLQDRLRRWELLSLQQDASLLVTELVTNSVLHAQSAFHVVATVADGVLEVGVTDHAPQLPRLITQLGVGTQPEPYTAMGGRGIALVDELAEDWGVVALDDGKQVWFRLSVDADWSYRTACPCGGDDLERIRLESGRFAVAVPGEWDDL
jgi:anti-sigma regulatory factor (Ser/Thr protein kinase)